MFENILYIYFIILANILTLLYFFSFDILTILDFCEQYLSYCYLKVKLLWNVYNSYSVHISSTIITVGLLTLLSRNNVFYSPESMFPPVLDHWHLYVLSSQNKNIFKYNYVQVFLGIYQMFMPIFTWIRHLKEKIYELSQ